ncbi:SDR family NAD(P)-dependent oxidoreductase [Spirosoma soli]|uniref:SDR family NAD(P)-dependent oxidoreductase n=1 Tax=Spirosoma soli TaxID=1770529 RepID=A0ABW5M4I1_9BACT
MKNIIVTGSASGFGLLTVHMLAEQGHRVYATMRNVTTKNAKAAQDLKNWAEAHHVDVRVVELDVTSGDSVTQAIIQIAADAEGKIDVLINNAGLLIWEFSEALSTKQVDQIFQVNVMGADRMNKAVLPYMHRENSGLLVHLSSGLSRLHLPYMGAYSAAKAAIDVLAETLHYELSKTGIDSIVIQPGVYPTTDLFTKQLPQDKAFEEEKYGAFGARVKQGIVSFFAPTPQSPDPSEVARLIAEIIDMPKDHRKLFTAIGIGGGQPVVEEINDSTNRFSLHVQGALGLI